VKEVVLLMSSLKGVDYGPPQWRSDRVGQGKKDSKKKVSSERLIRYLRQLVYFVGKRLECQGYTTQKKQGYSVRQEIGRGELGR